MWLRFKRVPHKEQHKSSDGFWLQSLQDATCTWNWLGFEHWECIHNNNNNKNNNNNNNNNNNFFKDIHFQTVLIRVHSIINNNNNNNNNKLLMMMLILYKINIHQRETSISIQSSSKTPSQFKIPRNLIESAVRFPYQFPKKKM